MAITQQGWRAGTSGGGGGGGLTSLPIENTVYVAKNGNDATGQRNRLDKPFLTIAGANSVAQAGDCVYVFAGVYSETGDTFLTDVYYNLEEGVTIQHIGATMIFDLGVQKNIYIFGNGVLKTLSGGGYLIDLQNINTTINLNCFAIESKGGGMFFQDCTFDVNISSYMNTEGGIGIALAGVVNGVIRFDEIFIQNGYIGIATAQFKTDGKNSDVFIYGRFARFEPTKTVGVGMFTNNGNNTRLYISINTITQFTNSEKMGLFVGNGYIVFDNVFFRQKITNAMFEISESPNITFTNCEVYCESNYFIYADGTGSPSITLYDTNVFCNTLVFDYVIRLDGNSNLSLNNSILRGCESSIYLLDDSNKVILANVQLISAIESVTAVVPNTPIQVQGMAVANQLSSANVINIITGTNIIVDSQVTQTTTLYYI